VSFFVVEFATDGGRPIRLGVGQPFGVHDQILLVL
jgi:hypothetical protein